MTSTVTAVEEQFAPELPNKYIYPEFAGFSGEDLLHDIMEAILPLSLYRTWEIFERKHAYDNDCFLSLGTVAKKARRTQRTVNRNIATFLSRGLVVLRSEYKIFRNSDGSAYKKAVVVKDFSGLYALAHEYYKWQYSAEYLAPEYEYVEHIQSNPRLQAKLSRFEDYRRLLEHHRNPFAQVQEDRRFTEYREEPVVGAEDSVEDAESQVSGQNKTKIVSKEQPNVLSKKSDKRINKKAYKNDLCGDSFDSKKDQERGEESNMTCTIGKESIAPDYTKGFLSSNGTETNSVFFAQKRISSSTSSIHENARTNLSTRQTEIEALAVLKQPIRYQAKELPPPKHPLASSFVHEVTSLFGDLNEKGSKTGIERSIEMFALKRPVEVLLCLVRAYVVARDTRAEKIRHRHPRTGVANRMPLFCTMFRKFAQALGPGSAWQYTWEQMLEDIAADDRLSLWLSEHLAEFVGGESSQIETTDHVGTPEISSLTQSVAAKETVEVPGEEKRVSDTNEEQLISPEGWKTREDAYTWAAYALEELTSNGYGGLEVSVILPEHIDLYQVTVRNADGLFYCLVCEDDIHSVVAMACSRTLFVVAETSG